MDLLEVWEKDTDEEFVCAQRVRPRCCGDGGFRCDSIWGARVVVFNGDGYLPTAWTFSHLLGPPTTTTARFRAFLGLSFSMMVVKTVKAS